MTINRKRWLLCIAGAILNLTIDRDPSAFIAGMIVIGAIIDREPVNNTNDKD